jgi:hypothetical protein
MILIYACLRFILNFSIQTTCVENDWKNARVTPIFKSGDNHIVNNYRPVSVYSRE